jgi:hypothetical protein
MANYTKITAEGRYLDGVSMGFIKVENEAKNIYLDIKVWYYETRTSWGHKAEICGHYGDNYVSKHDFKNIYYNRTWENYRFQSVLHRAFYECGLSKKIDKKEYDALWEKIDQKCKEARF